MANDKLVQTWYPIKRIALFENLTQGGIESTEENLLNFRQCENEPHVLDNETVDRGIKLMKNQLEDADLMDNQIFKWREDALTEEQSRRVDNLYKENQRFRDLTNECLKLCIQLRKGNINNILEMDEEELALKVLLGEIKQPF